MSSKIPEFSALSAVDAIERKILACGEAVVEMGLNRMQDSETFELIV